ncbi:hypothetical protein NDU88_006305 [Pleurodeles waltl]|uniref:Uncharacterized protein n=1 Tax=Pleurodeles waltl TaxID=8319 RepID=A0AAV7WC48_PLEWA|nr:hypothetical protein NDU88_006305 [Pleurodeles waltl]
MVTDDGGFISLTCAPWDMTSAFNGPGPSGTREQGRWRVNKRNFKEECRLWRGFSVDKAVDRTFNVENRESLQYNSIRTEVIQSDLLDKRGCYVNGDLQWCHMCYHLDDIAKIEFGRDQCLYVCPESFWKECLHFGQEGQLVQANFVLCVMWDLMLCVEPMWHPRNFAELTVQERKESRLIFKSQS